MKIQNLIIGAGISGCVLAERLSSKGESVLIIDKRNHTGGNCYDYYDENGILIHKYGPHIFRTSFEDVKTYVNKFTNILDYQHKNLQFIDGLLIPFPFNFNALYKIFPESYARLLEDIILKHFEYGSKVSILEFNKIIDNLQSEDKKHLKVLSDFITNKTYKNYVIKQRGLDIDQVDKSIFDRVPINISRDDRAYSNKKYQGLPEFGYTKMFEKMLDSEKISILLNVDYKKVINDIKYDRLICTAPIDEFFDYKYGVLDYKKTLFKIENYNLKSFQEGAVISYPNDYDYTRITEMKKFYPNSLVNQIERTAICKEYPLIGSEKAYPVEIKENLEIFEKYKEEATKLKNIYFLGRLANYKYQDMDVTFKNALDFFNTLE